MSFFLNTNLHNVPKTKKSNHNQIGLCSSALSAPQMLSMPITLKQKPEKSSSREIWFTTPKYSTYLITGSFYNVTFGKLTFYRISLVKSCSTSFVMNAEYSIAT